MSISKLIKHEGNEKRFTYNGIECIILRACLGHLCGYVKVPENHKWHNASYPVIESMHYFDIPIHGGLTFSGVIPGDVGYWVGFDCGHTGDLLPRLPNMSGDAYRDMEYVQKEIKKLVDFLLSVKEDCQDG